MYFFLDILYIDVLFKHILNCSKVIYNYTVNSIKLKLYYYQCLRESDCTLYLVQEGGAHSQAQLTVFSVLRMCVTMRTYWFPKVGAWLVMLMYTCTHEQV